MGGPLSPPITASAGEKQYFLELEISEQIALMQRIRAASRPERHAHPGPLFRPEGGDQSHERAHASADTARTASTPGFITNPGTLDAPPPFQSPRSNDFPRCVRARALLRGVADRGAADGYGRMAVQSASAPARTSTRARQRARDLHNSLRARTLTPIVNIVATTRRITSARTRRFAPTRRVAEYNVSRWWGVEGRRHPSGRSADATSCKRAAAGRRDPDPPPRVVVRGRPSPARHFLFPETTRLQRATRSRARSSRCGGGAHRVAARGHA